jgi:hypothetical protein
VIVKILFAPFSVLGGILAGLVGKKLFETVWRAVDDQEPPDPKHRDVAWQKLLAALVLEGAIFRAARGVADYGSRRAFWRLTRRWPGEERPDAG